MSKWTALDGAVNDLLGKYAGSAQWGLSIFPHSPANACSAGQVDIPVGAGTTAGDLDQAERDERRQHRRQHADQSDAAGAARLGGRPGRLDQVQLRPAHDRRPAELRRRRQVGGRDGRAALRADSVGAHLRRRHRRRHLVRSVRAQQLGRRRPHGARGRDALLPGQHGQRPARRPSPTSSTAWPRAPIS